MSTHELLLLKIKKGRDMAVKLKKIYYNPLDPRGIEIAATAGGLIRVIDNHVHEAVASEEYAAALLATIAHALETQIMPLLGAY